MNNKLFEEHTSTLINIIQNSSINKEEKKYRETQLLNIYYKMKEKNEIDNRYYNLSHEIRYLEFLSHYGNLKIANDRKSESGCDFLLNDQYQIECVCSSSGDEKANGFDKFYGNGIFDYNEKENIILTRLTNSINEKLIFYYGHLVNGTILKNKPYIIFLGLGNLSNGFFPGKFGFALNKILFGVGYEQFHFKEDKVIKKDYSHKHRIINHNGSDIDCNIFANERYLCVSAIIFTTASLPEKYDKKNTFLFINPFSRYKVKAKFFDDMIYWKKIKMIYICRDIKVKITMTKLVKHIFNFVLFNYHLYNKIKSSILGKIV